MSNIANALAAQQRRRQMQLWEAADMAQTGSQRAEHRPWQGVAGPASTLGSHTQHATHLGPVPLPSEQRILAMMKRLHPTALYLAVRRRALGGPDGHVVGPARRWRKPLPWVFTQGSPAPLPRPENLMKGVAGPTGCALDETSKYHSESASSAREYGQSPSLPPSDSVAGPALWPDEPPGPARQAFTCKAPCEGPKGRADGRDAVAPPEQQGEPVQEQRRNQQQTAQQKPPPPPLETSQQQQQQHPFREAPSRAASLGASGQPEPQPCPQQSLQRQRTERDDERHGRHAPPLWQVQQQQAGWYPFGNLLSLPAESPERAADDAALGPAAEHHQTAAATATATACDTSAPAESIPEVMTGALPRPPPIRPAPAPYPQPPGVKANTDWASWHLGEPAPAPGRTEAFRLACKLVHHAWSYLYDTDMVEEHLVDLERVWEVIRREWAVRQRQRQRHDAAVGDPWPAPREQRAPDAKAVEQVRDQALEAARQADERLQQMLQSRPPLAELLRRGLGAGRLEFLETVAALDVLRPGLLARDRVWRSLASAAHREQEPDILARIRRRLRGTGLEGVAAPAGMVLHAAVVGLVLLDASPEPNRGASRAGDCGELRVYECATLGVLHLEVTRRASAQARSPTLTEADPARWRLALSPMQLYHMISFDTFVVCRPEALLLFSGPGEDVAGRCRQGTCASSCFAAAEKQQPQQKQEEEEPQQQRLRRRMSRFAPEYFRHLLATCLAPGDGGDGSGEQQQQQLLLQVACSEFARDWALSAPSLPSSWARLEAVLLGAARCRERPLLLQETDPPQLQTQRPGLPQKQSPREMLQQSIQHLPPPSPEHLLQCWQQQHQRLASPREPLPPPPQRPVPPSLQQQQQLPASPPCPEAVSQRPSLLQRVRQAGLLEARQPQQAYLQLALQPSPQRTPAHTCPNGPRASPRTLAQAPPTPQMPPALRPLWVEPPQGEHQPTPRSPPAQRHRLQSQSRQRPQSQPELHLQQPHSQPQPQLHPRSQRQPQTQPCPQLLAQGTRAETHPGLELRPAAKPAVQPGPQSAPQPEPHSPGRENILLSDSELRLQWRLQCTSMELQPEADGAATYSSSGAQATEQVHPPAQAQLRLRAGKGMQAAALEGGTEQRPQGRPWLEMQAPQWTLELPKATAPQPPAQPQPSPGPLPQVDAQLQAGPYDQAEPMLQAGVQSAAEPQTLPGAQPGPQLELHSAQTKPEDKVRLQSAGELLSQPQPQSQSQPRPHPHLGQQEQQQEQQQQQIPRQLPQAQQPERQRPPPPSTARPQPEPQPATQSQSRVAPPTEAEIRRARQICAPLLRPARCGDVDSRDQLRCVLRVLRLAATHGLLDAQHGHEAQSRAVAVLRRAAAADSGPVPVDSPRRARGLGGAACGGEARGCADFVERHKTEWARRWGGQRRLPRFLNGELPEEQWGQLAREMWPGLLELHGDSWGKLLLQWTPPAPAQLRKRQQQHQHHSCSHEQELQGRPGAQRQRKQSPRQQRQGPLQQQQDQQRQEQGWFRRWLPGFNGLSSKPSPLRPPQATSKMTGAAAEAAEEEDAVVQGVEKEGACSNAHEAGLRHKDRRKLAWAALWGLAALCGFEVPLEFVSLACCLAAGSCMIWMVFKERADTMSSAAMAADLFRCLAFLPPLPYLPRDDAWVAAVLPAESTVPPPPAADLPLHHHVRQQRLLAELEYGVRLWLSYHELAGLLTECTMPPSMALAQAPQREQLRAALLARWQAWEDGAVGSGSGSGSGSDDSNEGDSDGGSGDEGEDGVVVKGRSFAGAVAGAPAGRKPSLGGGWLFWGGRS